MDDMTPRKVGMLRMVTWTVLALLFLLLVWLRSASATEVLLIVDQDGRPLMRCTLPTVYLLPPAKALVCEQAPIYRDGFEP